MAILLLPVREDPDVVEVLTEAEKRSKYIPDDFESSQAFLDEAMQNFNDDVDYDDDNREAALDDLIFTSGDQWDETVLKERQKQGRPCLTINTLPQFIGQVIGERVQNSSSIRVLPRGDGTKETAQLRADLIRGIEVQSDATDVYDKACENQITCGIANMRVDLDFTDDDVFDQDIFIKSINNPLAVIWDRMSVEMTGKDANHCFVVDTMTKLAFETKFPDVPALDSFTSAAFQHKLLSRGWVNSDIIRVVEYWRMLETERELAMFNDGSIRDITDMDEDEFLSELLFDSDGETLRRKVFTKIAQMHLITGFSILEGPYEIPLPRLPIIKVTGREVEINDKRVRFGLVRFAKDPQRLKNYWRSVAAETLALAPKAQWIAPSDAMQGREEKFRNAHRSGDPLLIYNKNTSTPPKRVDPPKISDAILFEARNNSQDMKDVTGIQDASLGIESNEVSGRAITRRAERGSIATIMYHKNLNVSIREVGKVVNALIPLVYDAPRTVRVVGVDDEDRLIRINDEFDPDSIDLSKGRYDVVVTTGPNFATKREESAVAMLNAVNAFPQLMALAGDIIVEAQDWPMAEKLAARLRKAIPPELRDPTEEEAAEAEEQAQLQREAQQIALRAADQEQKVSEADAIIELQTKQVELKRANVELLIAEAGVLEAKADAAKATAEAAQSGVNVGVTISKTIEELKQIGTPPPPTSSPTGNGLSLLTR